MGKGATVSLRDDAGPAGGAGEHEALALILNAARPLDPPTFVPLAEIDEVSLGRGPTLQVVADGSRRLRIDLPDAAISVSHATITRAEQSWAIADGHSKNGTLVNGRPVSRAVLAGEELLELGNSFFCLGRGMAPPAASESALRTLNARLAAELDVFARLARSKVTMLILGETGTGKEVLARAAHEQSGREGPFVAVNCGAIPETLVESELFGVRKGAYSGASADRIGKVAAADRGTLFLDEVAELPESSQAALLRVLQDGEVVTLGSTRPVHVNVRILAATHEDLPARVTAGRFRDDLYSRLRGHVLTLPPLRARREDLGLLVAELLRRVAGERAPELTLQRAAARALLSYRWPHNVRELESVLARAVALLGGGGEIRIDHLPGELVARAGGGRETPADERTRLLELLRRCSGNLSAVARELSTSRTHVQRLLARHAIDLAKFRGAAGDEPDEG